MKDIEVKIQFTRPANVTFPWFSWMVRLFEGTDYSHVRLMWKTGRGVPCVYEASAGGLHFKGPIADRGSVEIIYEFSVWITQYDKGRLVDMCVRHAGLEYGKRQVLGIALARLMGVNYNPLSRGSRRQICSEVVLGFLSDICGWKTDLNRDLAGIKDIYDLMVNNVIRKK